MICKKTHGPKPIKKEETSIVIVTVATPSFKSNKTTVIKKMAVIGWMLGRGAKAYLNTTHKADNIATLVNLVKVEFFIMSLIIPQNYDYRLKVFFITISFLMLHKWPLFLKERK